MTKTAFISRALSDSAVFETRLKEAGWLVEGASLVEIKPSPFSIVPEADWVFFASKNAVRCFFEQVEALPLAGPGETGVSLAALGLATAAEIEKYTGKPAFIGTGDPVTTAAAFKPLATGMQVLFPAARNSRRSVPELLGESIKAIHLIVYDNTAVSDLPKTKAVALVFTSPLNAQAYLSKYPLEPNQRLVAIGQTTAKALAEMGFSEVEVAAGPSEAAMADAVLALRK